MTQRDPIADARDLRQRQTEAESLLWNVLRASQLSGLKFRRQHPEPPYILDFACFSRKVTVEIDGGYHDLQFAKDQRREEYLIEKGWKVIRFANEDVLADVEAVAIAITKQLEIPYQYKKRKGGVSNVFDRQRIAEDQSART